VILASEGNSCLTKGESKCSAVYIEAAI